ncbi:MAG: hypothetical protein DRH08_10030 [Deltaproteobacteria bacterium]|nr:MAG: hypothetical protein DRH08_10030 [Deltaproteobacteria bacterium]
MDASTTLRLQPAALEIPAAKKALNRLLRLKPAFSLNSPYSPQRPALKTYIEQQFSNTYGATITEFLPLLSSMECNGNISAVAGIRPAQKTELFVERYLDAPIEVILSQLNQTSIDRSSIVEIGNLSATHRGATLLFFVVQIAMLHEAGIKWDVFAATHQVGTIMSKLNFISLELGPADPARLGDDASNWGSYYDTQPTILATNIAATMENLRQSPLTAAVLVLFKDTITELAQSLRS